MHATPSKISISPRKMVMVFTLLIVVFLFSITSQSVRAQSIIYVDADATGAADGSNWDDAYLNLQDALTTAVSGDEIWIAEGIYYPSNSDQNATFQLIDGLAIYGGFVGNETDRSDADWEAYPTVLSGDIDQNDTVTASGIVTNTANTSGNNSLSPIVSIASAATGVHIEGVTITAGKGTGLNSDTSDLTMTNVAFWGNVGTNGGGMYSAETTAVLTNVHFYANKATTGGGLRTHGGGTMQIIGGVFKGNQTTGDGGGFYNRAATTEIYNAVFSGNKGSLGAAFYNRNAQATLTNSTVSGNLAVDETNGAAIHNRGNTAVVDIQNSIVWNNGTVEGGIGLGSALGGPNTINVTYSLVQDDTVAGNGNLDSLDADNMPYFVEPVFPLDAPTTSSDLRLPADAPTVDAGENSFVSGVTTDLLGDNRVQNGTVNMGAYETAESITTACGLIYVDHAATGNDDGTSWVDAYPTVQDALQSATSFDRCEIWVADGTYYPDEGAGQSDNDVNATFSMQDGISLYGGFAGNESLRSERDWERNATILSGDIDQNDGEQISGSNTNTLITAQRANFVVDGVTLTATEQKSIDSDESVLFLGNSRLEGIEESGIYAVQSSTIIENFLSTKNEGIAITSVDTNILLLDSLFTQNEARSIQVYSGNFASINRTAFVENSTNCDTHVDIRHLAKFVQLQEVDFSGNDVVGDGCGQTAIFQTIGTKLNMGNTLFDNNATTAFAALTGSSQDIALNNVSFINNISEHQGGGARLDLTYYDDVSLTNVLFAGNQSAAEGGGLYLNNPQNIQLTNVAFNKNHAGAAGGGIFLSDNDADLLDATFTNVTIANNHDTERNDRGAGITLAGNSEIVLQNSVLWNNYTFGYNNIDLLSTIAGGSWSATYSLIQNRNPGGTGNLAGDTDPLFISEIDIRLQLTSPLLNMGNNSAVFNDENGNATDITAVPYDLAGGERIQGGTIDLGAYERHNAACVVPVLYVDKDAGGSNDGSTWADAYTSFSTALSNVDVNTHCEIWVAEGEYIPTIGTRFDLPNGVAVYGGFDGTETERDARDWSAHLTVLSGDLDQNDSKTNTVVTDIDDINGTNSTVVVQADSTFTQTTRLDGVVITAGDTGIYNAQNEWLLVENVTLQGNRLHGMMNVDSAPRLINVNVLDNGRSASGGGLFNDHASPMLVNVLLARNEATQGAGIYNSNQSRPRLINLTMVDNIASDVGGAIYMTGGSVGTLQNSLLWGNEDSSGVGTETAVFATANATSNHLTISYSLLQGQNPAGTDNLDGNDTQYTPQFVAATDYRMVESSPTINEGSNDAVNYVGYGSGSMVTTDLDQTARVQWQIVDLGAYETALTQCGNSTPIYVNHAATGKNDGSSWIDAYTTLQDALQYGSAHCEVWVAQGSYHPDDGGINPKQGLATATFDIPAGMALYGGFDGSELSRTERNWQATETVLSGYVTDSYRQAYHVVSIVDVTDVQLDGFTIQKGGAEYIETDDTYAYGGGIYLADSSSITLTHMIINDNRAALGGGIGNLNSQVTIINSEVSDNLAYNGNYDLGYHFPNGDYFEMGYGEIQGGGIYNDGDMTLLNSTVAYNSAPQEVYDDWFDLNCSGQVGVGQDPITGYFCDCDTYVGGLWTDCWDGLIFLEAGEGGGISNSGQLAIQNSIVWGNTTNDKYPDSSNLDGGANQSNSNVGGDDPQFISNSDLRLEPTSPMIDAGNNALYNNLASNIETDLGHNLRINNLTIDIGAYEDDTPLLSIHRDGNGFGSVSSDLAGIDCGADCYEQYDNDEVVTLTAVPDAISTFAGWSGACSGLLDCVVTMDVARTVTATFALKQYTLTTAINGNGSGSFLVDPSQALYEHGTIVTVTHNADTGSTFTNWGGACTGNSDCVVTMDDDKVVVATYTLNQYALTTATDGNGTGDVSLDPAGGTYDYGTAVTVTHSANTGSTFTGWSGACTGSGDCVVTIDSAKSVTATFTINQYDLTTEVDGNGSGTVILDPADGPYEHGTAVTVTHNADIGSTFSGWSGACNGMSACVVTMDSAQVVTATFTLNQFDLTTGTDGNGFGAIELNPAGGTYDYGTAVTVTHSADIGSSFTGWSGACTGTGDCVVTMDATKIVTATFDLNSYSLTVNHVGSGNSSIEPDDTEFLYGTTVTITAVPDSSHYFEGWSGDLISADNPLQIVIDDDKTITATFAAIPPTIYSLDTAVVGNGTITPSSNTYISGTVVTVTAVPEIGWDFAGWDGDLSGNVSSQSLLMDSDKQVTATFTIQQYELQISKSGDGFGLISSEPAGIDCGADCVETLDYGTVVTLTAVPDADSSFMGWSGACSGTGSCVVTMDEARAVVAEFELDVVEYLVFLPVVIRP